MDAEYVPARPPAALRRHVLRYLGYTEHADRPLRRRQAPASGVALILGFHPLGLSGPALPTTTASAFVGGLGDTWVLTEFTGPQAGVQVDLTPLGAYTLLGGRALPGGAVPGLDQLEDPALASLPDRLAATPSWAARFALVSAFVGDRLLGEGARHPAPEVAHAWHRLARSGGRASVAGLAAETGWSRRHLQSRFTTQIGLGPRTAGRVLRFAGAARLVGGTPAPLAEIAATCGYADQPHLSREFRSLAGISPAAFRAEWATTAPEFPNVHDEDRTAEQDLAS
ncbi:helix-turn-helix transcriptional regulator [Pseudonocardia nematodicida]|uniref:Helix-turn-helix transcriptional regulator n=1 Tax=Pseudonocardia nematodicida TaxID=1206997 RepID=A0ABV1K672_9PSEU